MYKFLESICYAAIEELTLTSCLSERPFSLFELQVLIFLENPSLAVCISCPRPGFGVDLNISGVVTSFEVIPAASL